MQKELVINCNEGVIHPDGTRDVKQYRVKSFINMLRMAQWLENNTVELINDGWAYDYHVSRSMNPGEVCEFKEFRKTLGNNDIVERVYIPEVE